MFKMLKKYFILGILALLIGHVIACKQDDSVAKSKYNSQHSKDYIELEASFSQAHQIFKERKFDEAFNKMKPIAEKGYSKAQFVLGVMYLEGLGTKKNITEAFKWIELSAMQDYPPAQVSLGEIYFTINKDIKKSNMWIDKAAANGDYDGYIRMAQIYAQGEYVEKDLHKSIEWLNKANHTAEAQYFLGLVYFSLKEPEKSKLWLKKAIEQNHFEAKEFLQNNF